ncbi:probable G-protein coupled receptor 139 [Leucoraja erinacea]|uniref:probable G-protein coupled receptor 139 n=1 Tax=Leucoraja erinaceus TaxID=7782 RepID=UPI0024557071|nr:probable G-protein coupled receptor 139 [Leucoraja erinacea]
MGAYALHIEIFYPIIAVIGVPANLMSLVILFRGKCGLSKDITCYMIAMAMGDLMVLVFNVIVSQIVRYHFPGSPLRYTPVCRLSSYLQGFSFQLSTWFTVSFTCDRFVAICCQKLRRTYCTERTAAMVLATVGMVSVLTNVPLPLRYRPCYTVHRVAYGCCPVPGHLESPLWSAHGWASNLLNTFLPIPALLLLNSLTARYILGASRARLALKGPRQVGGDDDPEVRSRRASVALLFAVSGSFVALSVPIMVIDAWVGVSGTVMFRGPRSLYAAVQVAMLLKCLGSCTNTCVYALTQSRFRAQMIGLLTPPFAGLCIGVKRTY